VDDCAVKILITGAGGVVGSMLRGGLRDSLAGQMRLLDLNPIQPGIGDEVILGDITNLAVAREAISGCDACVHLAGIPVEASFDKILHANIQGTWSVFEAARLEGCPRVVFASSNHATGYYSINDHIGPADTPRPDSYYGASKLFGEALGRCGR
jgi:uronate dehydrogenase